MTKQIEVHIQLFLPQNYHLLPLFPFQVVIPPCQVATTCSGGDMISQRELILDCLTQNSNLSIFLLSQYSSIKSAI